MGGMNPSRLPELPINPEVPKAPESESAFWGQDPGSRPYGLDLGLGPAQGSVPVSVTIITRNEEKSLPGCLASVAFAAEVVVVDAESTDRTAALAEAAGAQVYVRPWPGFTAQRNFSLAQCTHDWILSIDADERISLTLACEIAALLAGVPAGSAYRIPELNRYFGRWLKHGGVYPGYHISLFDRRRHSYEKGPADVHEDVHSAESGALTGHMLHLAYPSFHLALTKLNNYTDLEALGRHGRGVRGHSLDLLRRPLGRFFTNYFIKRGFLDGMQGFLYCCLTALYAFTTSVKLWELERDKA
jgi:glycosyltransferase involved in cell wall biosynthesis